MIGGILLLGIAIFGLMVLFGQADAKQYYRFLIFLIIAPVLLAIGFNHVVWFWAGLPLWAQILGLLALPFLLSAVLRQLFPKSKWIGEMQALLFQMLIYIITFPVRLLWRAGRLIFLRERNNVRLNPYRPVVGGQPPIDRTHEQRLGRNDRFEW